MFEVKTPKSFKDTTKREFEDSFNKLLDAIKSNGNAKSFSKEIDLCSRLYTKGKEEEEVGYYTKYFVEQSNILFNKITA